MDENSEKRGKWANKTEFFLSCMGYAIGTGNVWRFPYLCYRNGGGAFLVPYLLMLLFCGIPLFFLEASLGQFASTGCITLFRISPLFKGVGYAIVIVNFITTTYYNVIIGYPVIFFINSLRMKLPWTNCDNYWNTPNCFLMGNTENFDNLSMNMSTILTQRRTSTDEFFHNYILQISDDINELGSIVWPVFFSTIFVWIITYICIMKGVKTVGKVVYFTATFPFFVLFILFVRGVTLPGAWNGIYFYLHPEWAQLKDLKVWTDAACQIFFSLGPGWGGIVNMASYNDFRNNNKLDSILVPILNCGTSIFAGFVVFSVLGYMSHQTGIPVSSVATGGPGLAFVTYPEAIAMLPWPHLWALLFFLMLFFLGLDTVFVQIEAIVSSVLDEYPKLRKHKMLATLTSCIVMMMFSFIFTTNGGMYWLQLFDWYAASITVILICLSEVVIVGWIYGIDNFIKDLEFMIQEKIHWWWILSWQYINPSILTFIFITSLAFNTHVTYRGIVYPQWAINVGWVSCSISMLCIPIYMGYKLLYQEEGDLIDRIKHSTKPSILWGPATKHHRREWYKIANFKENISHGVHNDKYHEQFIELCSRNV